ncbi:SCO3374 family protein [Streptomyces sp. NPDC002677]|uniref:SCO3374 family protein n=1 Tax=Streptomyces sp. NPDC002677 TaxID=3154774 RepID=UPI00332AEB2F
MAGTVPLAASTVPHPRRPLGFGVDSAVASDSGCALASGSGRVAGPDGRAARLRHWYENELGWATVPETPGEPLRLVTGVRFDVLDVPAPAGAKALRHLGPGSPVALRGDRMRLLVAAGSAEELPGLLDWLEWGALALDLRALGAHGRMDAPVRALGAHGRMDTPVRALGAHVRTDAPVRPEPVSTGTRSPSEAAEGPVEPGEPRAAVQGAAVWLRPPESGCEVEDSLPRLPTLSTRSAMGGVVGAPDLVRLVDTVATECHRIRLRRVGRGPEDSQPLASS